MSTSSRNIEITPISKVTKETDIGLFLKSNNFYVSAAIFIASLFYYLSYASYGFSESDWGGIVVAAERILQGDVFYKDFSIGYTPGIYLYTALAFKIFGVELLSATIAWSIIRAINCLLIYLLGSKFVSRKVALLLPLILWFAAGPLHKSFLVSFELLHLLIFLRLLLTDSKGFYFFSGIVAGISLIFKIDLLGSFVITLLLVEFIKSTNQVSKATLKSQIVKSSKNLFFFSGGAIFAIAPLVLYLFSNSAMTDAIYQNLFFISSAKDRLFLLPPLRQLFSWGIWDFINYAVVFIPFAIYSILLAVIFSNIRSKQFTSEDKKLLVLVLYGLLSLHQILRSPWIGRLYQILPPILIADIYLISRYYFRHGRGHFKKLHLIYRAVLTPTNFILLSLIIGSCTLSDIYTNNSIFIRYTNRIPLSAPKAEAYTTHKQIEEFNRIRNIIEAETEKGEYIYIVQHYPMYYFVTGRKNATRYYLLEVYVYSIERQSEVVKDLMDKNVKLIISGPNQPKTPEATVVNEYIKEHYQIKETIGDKIIFIKK